MKTVRYASLLFATGLLLTLGAAAKTCSPPHAVYGLIGDRWRSLGASDGPLGCPITEEMDHPEGKGRYQRFEFGEIAWSPNTGPRSVQTAYLSSSGITVLWGETDPFHYDKFIVRWDKDGQNIGQQDVGSGSGGKLVIPFSGLGRYRIVVEGCDSHFLADSTCRQGWSNPVYVSFTGAAGKATPLSQPPFDLVARAVDPTGIPLNPMWAAQITTPGIIPDADAACFDRVYGDLLARFDRCTSQKTYRDTVNGPHAVSCTPGGTTPVHGHVNWWVSTVTGKLTWKSHEWPDDDYNFLITTPQNALVTAGNARLEENKPVNFDNPLQLKAEFDEEETVEHFHTPWWSQFKAAVDESDQAAAATLNGKDAIAIGLVGLDCVHECGSELHPLFAIAINVSSDEKEDVWAMFVRNWGNEGWCSEFRHLFQKQDFIFRLPWKPGAVGLTVLNQSGDGRFLTNNNQVTGPSVTWAATQGVDVAFRLPPPTAGARLNGELHLHWIMRGEVNPGRLGTSTRMIRSTSKTQARKVTTMARRAGGDEPLHALIEGMSPQQQQVFKQARLARPGFDAFAATIHVGNVQRLSAPAGPQVAAITVVRDLEKAARDEKRTQIVCAAYASKPPGMESLCQSPTTMQQARPRVTPMSPRVIAPKPNIQPKP